MSTVMVWAKGVALGTLSNVLFTVKQVGAIIKNRDSQIMPQKNYNMIRSWGKKKEINIRCKSWAWYITEGGRIRFNQL